MPDLSTFQSVIKARLAELDARMQDIETELDQPKPKDMNDQSVDLEDDEVLEAVGRAAQQEVQLLQAALKRIENGSYGICQGCGNPISDARLEAVPYAVVCRDCAQAAQSGAA